MQVLQVEVRRMYTPNALMVLLLQKWLSKLWIMP
jgi:hypothetical protein